MKYVFITVILLQLFSFASIAKENSVTENIVEMTCDCYEDDWLSDDFLGGIQVMGSDIDLAELHALHACERHYGCGERSEDRCGRTIVARNCKYIYIPLINITTTQSQSKEQSRYFTKEHFSKIRIVKD